MCFLDMHKSKLVVANIQSTNFGKTYTCFAFSTNLSKILCEKYFLERKTDTNVKLNI
jgi:hypothetical protein